MAKTRRPTVPQTQWEKHKDTIKQLYMVQNKSLEGPHGVMELMKHCGLCASKPQYETQFKRWGFRKKLTREAWHVIGHVVERGKARGMTSDVYVYGTKVSNEKVKKETARYRLCSMNKQSCGSDLLLEGVTVEHRPSEAKRPSTMPDEYEDTLPGVSPYETNSITQRELIEEHHSDHSGTDLDSRNPIEDLQQGLYNDHFPLSIIDDMTGPIQSPSQWPLVPSRLLTPSSQFGADAECVMLGLQDFHGKLSNELRLVNYTIPINTTSLLSNLDKSLLREFQALCMEFGTNVNLSISKTMPLLPWRAQQELHKSSVDVVILKQIMFLLMNNFAGSDYAAFDALFEQVKQFSISQMQDILDAIPAPYTSALQQSILTIAIKSNVPEIVKILLARGLDADRVTCRFAGSSFTPLGLACKFRRLDVVNIFIDAGVDVNQIEHSSSSTAMWHLLGSDHSKPDNSAELPPIARDILQRLMAAGARVGWLELENPHFWANKPLLDVYIRHAQLPTEFRYGYQLHRPLINAMRFCDFGRATSAIKTMLGRSFSLKTFRDPELWNRCLDAFRSASYQGNTSLIDYFLSIGLIPDTSCLCQAVRGNNKDVVLKCVRAGVNIDSTLLPNHYSLNMLRPYAGQFPADVDPYLLDDTSIRYGITTPFAEAIRWGHHDLAQMFRDLGIMDTIIEDESFAAALFAAAEAGNKEMIKSLLSLARLTPELLVPALSVSISIATLGNHMEIIELLMAAGIQPIPSSITAAILVRNPRLVQLFLDAAVSTVDISGLVYFAVRWGDISVIKQLIQAGAQINEYGWELGFLELNSLIIDKKRSPLGEAIWRGDHDVVQLLLDSGANMNPKVYTIAISSPLAIAIQSGNEHFARELLARGADPNDSQALLAAVLQSVDMAEAILGAFCRRHPTGDRHFASAALRKAIKDGNDVVVRMLADHTDVNNREWVREALVDENGVRSRRTPEYLPTPLGIAIATRNIEIVRILLNSGGDPNSTVATVLPYPRRGRWLAISQAICTSDLAMVKLLHNAGANLNFSATLGITRTALQLAVELGYADIVDFLLEHGVNVNAPSCIWGGGTALQLAAITGCVGIAELLLLHGANINAPGSKYQGRTAFEGAAEHGRMDMLLLLYHKGVDIVSDGGEQARRAMDFAEKNGQLAAKCLVEQLAERAMLDAIIAT